jgi:hypothetical protein
VAEPVAESTHLSIRPTLAPESVPWVRVEVKNCHPLAGRWLLGCRYLDAPPLEVLVLFG